MFVFRIRRVKGIKIYEFRYICKLKLVVLWGGCIGRYVMYGDVFCVVVLE